MTVKLTALYRRPPDEATFLHHYDTVHAPLVRQTPHLQSMSVSAITANLVGGANLFMIAEMHFADREAFDAAMASPENRAAGRDLMAFAGDLVTLIVSEAR